MATSTGKASSQLRQTLESESEVVSLFIQLLQQEQSDLAKGRTDGLAELADRKNRLAEQLSALAAERNRVLSENGFATDRPGIETWCSRHPSEKTVADAWARVLDLATQAKELHKLNGELIALRMRHNSMALEVLRNAKQPLSLYGPDGQQSSGPSTRRINDSA